MLFDGISSFFYVILATCKKYTFCKGRGRIQKYVVFKRVQPTVKEMDRDEDS